MTSIKDRCAAIGALQIAQRAGFTIRGFTGFAPHLREPGLHVEAKHIEFSGAVPLRYDDVSKVFEPIDLALPAKCHGLTIKLLSDDGRIIGITTRMGKPPDDRHVRIELELRVSDDGEIEVHRVDGEREAAPEPEPPAKGWF